MKAKNPPSLKAMAESKEFEGVSKSVPTFSVDPRKIQVKDGFNGRPIDLEHVAELRKARHSGAELPPVRLSVENGNITMVDGHHTLYGFMLDISEGIDIKSIPAMEFKGNDADRIMLMCNSQSGLKMTPLQLGVQYKNLITSCGWTVKQIADQRGKSDQHVSDMIALANSNSDVQAMVTRGEVSGKVALAIVKESKRTGTNAGARLAKAVDTAKAAGRTKVRAKDIPDDKLGDSYVTQIKQRSKVVKAHLDSMIESPTVSPALRVAVGVVLDTMGGRKNEATAPTKLETGLYWLQELGGNKQCAEPLRKAAKWFHDNLYSGAFVKGTATPAPSIMSLEDAIKTEMESDGEVMAESLCPEQRALIVYLRSGVK